MTIKNSPKVRFSVFKEKWQNVSAGEIFDSISDKNHPHLPLLSASQKKGMVFRDDIGIDIQYDERTTKNYKRVIPGQFVIHLRSFQGGFAFSKIEGITSPAYTVLGFKGKNDYYPLYWRYILSSGEFIKRLEAITYGIRDGRSISFKEFSTLKFRVPSYKEQIKIGDFFKDIDNAIALYEQELTILQQTKQGLLQKMFPKEGESVPEVRFPGFTEAWEQRNLNELMNFSNGINAPKESYGKGRKMISVMDILDKNPITYKDIRNSVEVNKEIEGKNRVENGDLTFVRSSEIVEEVGWSKAYLEDEYSLYSGFTIRGKKKNKYDALFIELNLNSSSRKQIERKAGGSTRYNVNQSILNSIVIREPRLEEQTKIGSLFKQLDQTITLHQHELDALKETQKAFLQKMFI